MSDTEMSYSAEHVQRLLQCSVCLDRFKQPKLLPCQHTFCLRPCLEGLVDRLTRVVRCPECRADHIVPRGGPSSFPNNLTIISFLELPPVGGAGGGREVRGRDVAPTTNPLTGEPFPPPSFRQHRSTPAESHAHGGVAGAVGGGVRGREAADGVGGGGCAACHTEGRLGRCSHCDQLLCEGCKRAHIDTVRADVNRLVSQVRRLLPLITEQINQIGRRGLQLQNRSGALI
jgi:tripartite motif-containing protein 71